MSGSIDIAVHSMKDVPSVMPDGLDISCLLPREDPRDAFLSAGAPSLAALAKGAVVGTASLRRKAILLNRRPDLEVVDLNALIKAVAAGAVAANRMR